MPNKRVHLRSVHSNLSSHKLYICFCTQGLRFFTVPARAQLLVRYLCTQGSSSRVLRFEKGKQELRYCKICSNDMGQLRLVGGLARFIRHVLVPRQNPPAQITEESNI